jgi:hypothetical protein
MTHLSPSLPSSLIRGPSREGFACRGLNEPYYHGLQALPIPNFCHHHKPSDYIISFKSGDFVQAQKVEKLFSKVPNYCPIREWKRGPVAPAPLAVREGVDHLDSLREIRDQEPIDSHPL